jgi:hypothetical protein
MTTKESFGMKEFIHDNGYKSRKFITVLLGIGLVVGACILWANKTWNIEMLRLLTDTVSTLVLGYCGISMVRTALPAATNSIAKTLTQNKNNPPQTNPPGRVVNINPKDQI